MTEGLTIHVEPTNGSGPAGKLAEVEISWSTGLLAGLKLCGFSVWERRGTPGLNVTHPARQYQVNGERRSFALLRPQSHPDAGDQLKAAIVAAYLAKIGPQPVTVETGGAGLFSTL